MGLKHDKYMNKYCFLSLDQRKEAKKLITDFKFFHDEATFRYQHDIGALIKILDTKIRNTMLAYKVPGQLLNETWNGFIGWSFLYQPMLVMYLVEIGDMIKPHVIKFHKELKTPPDKMTARITKTPK